MIRTIDTVNNLVILEGDDSGWGYHVRQLNAAPAGAKRMDIVWKYWMDSVSSDISWTSKTWNHTNCFGLSFDGVIPKVPTTGVVKTNDQYLVFDNFLGWSGVTESQQGALTYPGNMRANYVANIFATGSHGVRLSADGTFGEQYSSFFDGNGKAWADMYAESTVVTPHASRASSYTATFDGPCARMGLIPASPAIGATATFFFRLYASSVNKSMSCKIGYNLSSLTGDGMFGAIDAPVGTENNSWANAIFIGDVVSNYRPDFDNVVFPSYLIMRASHAAQKFVFGDARIRYYNYDDELLGSETLP